MLSGRLRRRSAALAALALACASSASAAADPPAAALVRLLHKPGRPHAFADPSGRIPLTALLPAGIDARAFGLVPVAPGIGAIRLAPDEVGPFAAAHPDLALAVAPPLRPLLDASKKWTRVEVFRKATGNDGAGVVVGIVDAGIDIRHPDFRDANGKTRIAWLLNAEAPRDLHPDEEAEFGCADAPCAIYSAADIDAILAKEEMSDDLRDFEGHGTHVASIAAGNGGPMVKPKHPFVGMAPGATLIVATPSRGGGFYDPDVLNAVRFIFDRAALMNVPAVVNLSIGGEYGPHDGAGILEKGLSAMVGDDKPGRVIVAAAGNSGDSYDLGLGDGQISGSHTEAHIEGGETVRIPIYAAGAADGQGFVWVTFRPGDDVSVALEGPGGERWIDFVEKGEQGGYETDKNTGAVVNNLPSANAAITAETNSAILAWTGEWEDGSEFAVHLRGRGDAQLWVVAGGDVGAGKDVSLAFRRGLRQGTINVPASAPGLLAVGCTVNRITWTPFNKMPIELTALGDDLAPVADSACYFSATGPNPFGVQKPEISAPGAFVVAAMSTDADPRKNPGSLFDVPGCPGPDPCYVVDDYHALAAGTSMSAPHVSGAVALLLQLDPTLTQARVTEVLQAGARRPGGHIPDPNQLGPGELDLEGARQALSEERASFVEADIFASWYTLSSAYARPDPSWPVWGTVELRRADGTIASGLDGTKLTLAVSGAAVTQPITKVRQGLFRFSIAGRAGEAGGTAIIEVLYEGVSLGVRELPIATDVWNAGAGFDATGGACACQAAGSRENGAGAAALAGGAIGAIAIMRRRQRRRARAPFTTT